MLKKVIFCAVFLVVLSTFVNAGSIGISPAKLEFFFEPNLHKTIDYRISNADVQKPLSTYVSGDLAEYVNLSKTSFIGQGLFSAEINLPEKIQKPGKHNILIGAIETDKLSNDSVIGGIAAVQAVIEIIVPYPGEYIEATLKVDDVNEGQKVPIQVEIKNLGTSNLNISSLIDVYVQGEGKSISRKDLGSIFVKSKETVVLKDFIDSEEFKPGSYELNFTLDYGEKLILNSLFRIGHFFVDIKDYSYVFEEKRINPFFITLENSWNLKMENVYAEVSVTDEGKVISEFKTPSINLEPWEIKNISGYFDASDVLEGKYTANIRVYYEDDSNFKLVKIYVLKKQLNKMWIIATILIVGILILIFILFGYLILKIRRLKKDALQNNDQKEIKKDKL